MDGDPWPCADARRTFPCGIADRELLVRHLLDIATRAAGDLRVAPAGLYHRFVAWALPGGTSCRVCGTHRHDVLPGLPPRLFPCFDLPLAIVSRKHTQLADVREETPIGYLRELDRKYNPDQTVKDTPPYPAGPPAAVGVSTVSGPVDATPTAFGGPGRPAATDAPAP